MKLFGNKATQLLTVTLDGQVVRPGEPIRAVVHVAGDPDDKSRQAVARMVCTHHWATETDVDDSSRTEVTWHDQTVVVDEHELVPEGTTVTEGDYPVTFTLPDSAIPSSADAVWWSVQGVVKRRMGKDVTGSVVFSVPTSEGLHAGVANGVGVSQHDPPYEIDAPVRTVRPGGTLTGTVVVKPTADVSYEKLIVDVQMVRLDKEGGRVTHRTGEHFSSVRLAEQLSVPAGAVKEFPFSVQLPDNASPTTYTGHTTKNWWLVASGMTKKLHRNQVFQLELNVYDDPPSTP